MKLYFTRDELLHGRDKLAPLTPEMEGNLEKLIIAISKVREAYGLPMRVSSGYRPTAINQSVGGAKASAHQSCQAVDIVDKDGKLAEWVMNNLTLLKECGIMSVEDPRYTKGWVHLSIRPVKSGKMVFIP